MRKEEGRERRYEEESTMRGEEKESVGGGGDRGRADERRGELEEKERE